MTLFRAPRCFGVESLFLTYYGSSDGESCKLMKVVKVKIANYSFVWFYVLKLRMKAIYSGIVFLVDFNFRNS